MFRSARIRLTAWYLLIIMSVSILFSLVIYSGINTELKGVEQRESSIRDQIEQAFPFLPDEQKPHVDLQPIQEARARLITTLVIINLIIFAGAGGAGYFLAGRTLRPIQEMVDQLNRFISDASHELRTPITSLRSEMEVGLRSKQLTLSQAKKLIESNMEEVIHLQMLSDNLLELTQYEKMNGRQAFDSFSLKTIAQEAVKSIQGQAKQKHIKVENTVRDATLLGNADRLRELFTILLDNAVKYSKPESIVKINGDAKGNAAIVRVIDEGIGIDKRELPFIFERFYRADESRSIKGFGLGLSIAKKITDLHNGSIQVVSTLHKGTAFTVRLPLHKAS
jgi:two-component system sensor histidine kinase CiaH